LRYAGIDIGANGGIAVIDNGQLSYSKLGEVKDWIKLLKNPVKVAIEDLHSIYGSSAKSNFSFGVNNGIVIGALECKGIDYVKVPPKTWQKAIWIPEDIVKFGAKVDTKATSLNAARRLYPNEQFLASSRSSVAHDGIVDAVLLAIYAYDCSLRYRESK
jgi:hypothetical protein